MQDGTALGGTVQDGPVEDGPVEDGPVEDGPVEDGPVEDGPVEDKTVEDGSVAWIDLDGAVNVRDLGALATRDGRFTVPGRLLRGDNLQDLSPADVRRLVDDIGVTTVIDLRSPHEVAAEGPGPLTTAAPVRHLYHSLLPELGTATDAAADPAPDDSSGDTGSAARTDGDSADRDSADRDSADRDSADRDSADRDSDSTRRRASPASVAAQALAIRRRDGARAMSPDDIRVGYYLGYLEDRPDQVVAALRGITQWPGAALVHCAAGKDRTGVVIALALTAAGVERDEVIADYAATGERMHAVLDRLRSSPTYADDTNSRPADEHMPYPQTMATFLDIMDARYGGVLSWLADHGFGPTDVSALRAKLLD
jgi:protein-tyrosine phosphatase